MGEPEPRVWARAARRSALPPGRALASLHFGSPRSPARQPPSRLSQPGCSARTGGLPRKARTSPVSRDVCHANSASSSRLAPASTSRCAAVWRSSFAVRRTPVTAAVTLAIVSAISAWERPNKDLERLVDRERRDAYPIRERLLAAPRPAVEKGSRDLGHHEDRYYLPQLLIRALRPESVPHDALVLVTSAGHALSGGSRGDAECAVLALPRGAMDPGGPGPDRVTSRPACAFTLDSAVG